MVTNWLILCNQDYEKDDGTIIKNLHALDVIPQSNLQFLGTPTSYEDLNKITNLTSDDYSNFNKCISSDSGTICEKNPTDNACTVQGGSGTCEHNNYSSIQSWTF